MTLRRKENTQTDSLRFITQNQCPIEKSSDFQGV